VDNCPLDYNPDQADTNGNGLGDACEGGGGGGGGGAAPLLIPVTGGSLIGSGIGHSCMTTADGLVICWGLNTSGQLGNATFIDSAIPVFVEGLDSVLRLSVGANHNCALKIDGTIWCWGSNVYGQLGDANTMNSNVPVQVQGLPGLATDITAGEHFNCANIEDGSIWCWGKNMSGQLNDGTLTSQKKAVAADFSTLPTQISGGQNDLVGENGGLVSLWKNKQSFGIEGLSNILNISGNRFTIGGCAAGLDGKVNCWGLDNTPVEVADIVDAIFVGTGQANACAIDLNQEVYCWGANSNGELGNGKSTNSTGGVKVIGLDPITALGVGAHHSCSLLPNGNAMCWGDNTWGQLGNDSHTDSSKPVLVILPTMPTD
jgi:alpha-tubulin suppressor-like RCC1 family protein